MSVLSKPDNHQYKVTPEPLCTKTSIWEQLVGTLDCGVAVIVEIFSIPELLVIPSEGRGIM